MRYVSIDIETTGLDPKKHQIIEFAAVIEDTKKDVPVEELPYFHRSIYHGEVLWEQGALNFHINNGFFENIKEVTDIEIDDLTNEFNLFLNQNGFTGLIKEIIVAGKNFATFDLRFIEETPFWECVPIKIKHRILDPAILFMRPEDGSPPNMKECLKRAGIEHSVKHRALEDARDVIRLIRRGSKK